MKNLLNVSLSLFFLAGCTSQPTMSTPSPVAKVDAPLGIEHAMEFSGRVESWGDIAPTSSSLTIWVQDIKSTNYVLFQVRANLDTYRFALGRDQVVGLIVALDNYQMTARQSAGEESPAVGWLYRTDIRMKRVGEDAKSERLIVNTVRKDGLSPVLSLTFDSWLLSFGGSSSPAGRAYKAAEFSTEEAGHLRKALAEFLVEL